MADGPFFRFLTVLANGTEIASGCHLRLTGSDSLSLRPGFFLLQAWDLSPSSAAVLAVARRIEVRSGHSTLAAGKVVDVHTHTMQGKWITEVGFSPGLDLWEASVSLSLAAGFQLSDTVREILKASGTGIQLVGFSGNEFAFSRGQVFFGRASDALEELAAAADAFAWLSPAGLVISGKGDRNVILSLSKENLLSAPTAVNGRMILSTSMVGWPSGAYARYSWHGSTGTGRILSRSIDADNYDGPWKSELMMLT